MLFIKWLLQISAKSFMRGGIIIATVAELLVMISADSAGLRKEIAASQRQIKRAFGPEALGLSGAAAGILGGIGAAMAAVGVASIAMSGKMQASEKAFATLIKDGTDVTAFLNGLSQYAADAPTMGIEGIQDSARGLLAFKFAAQDVIPIMNVLGDTSAMLNSGQQGLESMQRTIGQMQAKGKVQAEEVMQLAEAGVNAWQYLADSMGMSVADVMKKVSDGEVGAQAGINAILLGMQKDFKGGMSKQAKEIPGLWAAMLDNVQIIMTSGGDKLSEALNIKEHMQEIVNYLSTFAKYVKKVGINEALRDLIPKELSFAITALAGVLLTVAVPALVTFAYNAALALIPMLPLIAAGVALGAVGWLIWQAWEPLGEMFHQLSEFISNALGTAFNFVAAVANDAASRLLKVYEPIVRIFNKDLADSLKNWSASAEENAKKYYEAADNSAIRTKAAAGAMGLAWDDVKKAITSSAKEIKDEVSKIDPTFKGLSESATQGTQTSKKKLEELAKTAKKVSKEIESEWEKYTLNDVQRLDYWYNKQKDALEKSKDANENYARDMERLNQVYATKRAESEANAYRDALDKAYDAGSLSSYQAILNSRYAMTAQHLEGQRELLDLYYDHWNELNRSSSSRMAETLSGIGNEMQGFFSSAIAGTESWSEAFANMGQGIKQIFADMVSNWITSTIIMSMFGEAFAAAQTTQQASGVSGWAANTAAAAGYYIETTALHASSTATQLATSMASMAAIEAASLTMAASIAAAWASAAAMVSLATLGGNAAPAQAGIIATVALTQSLAVPALADGGITTGPTLAEIGEGRYKEAVLPLNKRIFEKMGLTAGGGGNKTININGDINTVADYRKMLNDIDRRISAGSRSK